MSRELLLLTAWLFGRLKRVLEYEEVIALCKRIDDHGKPDWVRLLEGTRSASFMSSARDLALFDFDADVQEAAREEWLYD